ncbi:MAG: efflux transporter, family, subunit [Chitinophagaceae bacterium]|nr:efflux transporter, family, subunit [Chitinophagaceae bacterium]
MMNEENKVTDDANDPPKMDVNKAAELNKQAAEANLKAAEANLKMVASQQPSNEAKQESTNDTEKKSQEVQAKKEESTSDQPKNKSKIIYIVGIIAMAALVFFLVHSILKRKHTKEEAAKASAYKVPQVHVVKPTLASDTAQLLLPGDLQGYRETSLYARVNGYIKNWLVDIGDPVREGQLLAEIETPELDQQLAQAKANLDLAKTSMDRVNSVSIQGAVSEQQKADRAGAYQAALAAVNQLEAQKSFKRVVAPFIGIITSRGIDIGTLVNSGSGSTNALFKIAQIDKLRIFVNVPQSFVSYVSIGTEAKIMVQEMQGKPVTGKVTRTAGALDPVTRTLLVQVEFNNPAHTYLPGMYAQVKFSVKRNTPPLIIPANTLIIRSAGTQVVTVTPKHTIAIKNITINKDNGATLEIADGLTTNELLVTNPSLNLTQGLKVQISKPTKQSHNK